MITVKNPGWTWIAVMGVLGFATTGLSASRAVAESGRFEVWAVDQADSSAEGGGLLYIWDGRSLGEPQVVDLGEAARAVGCEVARRPHMVLANHSDPPTHAIISNVGSGDVHFVDVATRRIVGCIGGTGNAHAAYATPDDTMVLVADLAGQKLHKIATDYASNAYGLVETLSLDTGAIRSALGTGHAKPVCFEFTADSRFAYVTLAGGGLLVVDVGSASGAPPMKVKHVYPAAAVPGLGCGAIRLADGDMLTNGESGADGGPDYLFRFDTRGATAGTFPPPVTVDLPGEDTHGAAVCVDRGGTRYVLTTMRVSNDVNVVDLDAARVVKTETMARPFSPDPKPDVAELAGNRLFVTLRGKKPLTAITKLESDQRTPGVAVLTVSEDCRSFDWAEPGGLLPMDRNPASDPHGLKLVRR